MTNVTDHQTVRRTRGAAALLRRAWLSLVLFIFAVASVAAGTYYSARPAWLDRADIRDYNAGVIGYYALATLADAPTTGDSPQAHFAAARAATQDQKLRSLAAYNLGTILGMDAARALLNAGNLKPTAGSMSAAGDSGSNPDNAQAELGQAVAQLADAVRSDPTNEDAKFNLELLEKLLPGAPTQSGQDPGNGYSPGQPNKGY